MDYSGKYRKIRKALHEASFDEFYQVGSVSQFHKMNIVAESAVLRMRFWFCIDGGYSGKDRLYIVRRKLPESGQDERIYYNNQKEMAIAIGKIGMEIRREKMKGKIYTHDEASLIIEMFENILSEHNIKVPSPEDEGRVPDNEAALYEDTHKKLMGEIEARLADLLARHTPHTEIVQGEFSGGANGGIMEEMTVKTPLGKLVIKASTDPENPGAYIDLRRPGCSYEAPVALVEVTSTEADLDGNPTLVTRVWDNVNGDEYQTRVIHSGIEECFRKEG